MRLVLIIALVIFGLSPVFCTPLLKSFYHAVYKVEFGPKYVQLTSHQNK